MPDKISLVETLGGLGEEKPSLEEMLKRLGDDSNVEEEIKALGEKSGEIGILWDIEEYYEKGLRLLEEGKYEEAEKLFEKIIERYPFDQRALFGYSESLLERGRYEGAILAYYPMYVSVIFGSSSTEIKSPITDSKIKEFIEDAFRRIIRREDSNPKIFHRLKSICVEEYKSTRWKAIKSFWYDKMQEMST